MRVKLTPEKEALLYDPQTSGGLLIAVDAADSRPMMVILRDLGWPVAVIGRVVAGPKPLIVV
jgi:selenide,water dikinase